MNVKFKKCFNKKMETRYLTQTENGKTKSHCRHLAYENIKDSLLSAVKYFQVKILSSVGTGYRDRNYFYVAGWQWEMRNSAAVVTFLLPESSFL